MDIILKEDIEKLGDAGEMARVADGYARNYLIPQGLAVEATPEARKAIEDHMKARAKRLAALKGAADDLAKGINQLSLTFVRKTADEEGKLFGSVTAHEIADTIIEKGFAIDKRKVLMDMPLKQVGEYQVSVKLHPEVTATVAVTVKGEEAERLDQLAAQQAGATEEAAAEENAETAETETEEKTDA